MSAGDGSTLEEILSFRHSSRFACDSCLEQSTASRKALFIRCITEDWTENGCEPCRISPGKKCRSLFECPPPISSVDIDRNHNDDAERPADPMEIDSPPEPCKASKFRGSTVEIPNRQLSLKTEPDSIPDTSVARVTRSRRYLDQIKSATPRSSVGHVMSDSRPSVENSEPSSAVPMEDGLPEDDLPISTRLRIRAPNPSIGVSGGMTRRRSEWRADLDPKELRPSCASCYNLKKTDCDMVPERGCTSCRASEGGTRCSYADDYSDDHLANASRYQVQHVALKNTHDRIHNIDQFPRLKYAFRKPTGSESQILYGDMRRGQHRLNLS